MMERDDLIGRRWTEIRQAARPCATAPSPDLVDRALALYVHGAWEVRFYAVIILGERAVPDERALTALHDCCGDDPSW